jgi:hypothetical protein
MSFAGQFVKPLVLPVKKRFANIRLGIRLTA